MFSEDWYFKSDKTEFVKIFKVVQTVLNINLTFFNYDEHGILIAVQENSEKYPWNEMKQ